MQKLVPDLDIVLEAFDKAARFAQGKAAPKAKARSKRASMRQKLCHGQWEYMIHGAYSKRHGDI